jgi:hypothetical protein
MGLCETTNKREKEQKIEAGGGLPPSEIIPQPIEVSNIAPNLTNKITNLDNSNNKEVAQNQPFKSINQNVEPSFEPVPLPIDIINSNLNNVNNSISNPINVTTSNPNNQIPLNSSLAQTEIIDQSQKLQPINESMAEYPGMIGRFHKSYAGQKIVDVNKRLYIIVQLPGRQVEITTLSIQNCLMDIEPYITPDSLNEFDFYDSNGQLINDLVYNYFYEWHDVNKMLKVILVRNGLNIPNDIRSYISKRTYLIGCLTFDNPNSIGLFIYNKLNNSTLSFEYSTNAYPQMKIVNQFSAFCNALNKLYISGGEIQKNVITDSFICLDLDEIQNNKFNPTILCNMKRKRYWHSMIYIPEKYIFIIGGPNEINVELYDIETNISKIDSQLNVDRCEPSLILVNNKFLYAFFGFHLYESFINSIERCNLHKRNRKWEMVEYKLSNTTNIARAFFGLTYIFNNILLVSDKENDNDLKPNYILSPGNGNVDTISEQGVLNSKNPRLFGEKFFIPFNDNESISLAFKSREPKIFIVNNNTGDINELCLKES